MKNIRFAQGAAFFILSALVAPLFASAAQISSSTIKSATPPSSKIISTSISSQVGVPLYLYIPSIKLYSKVDGVGVNKIGNMDVPSGRTTDVGWYKYGVIPGSAGTAVLDAHNTAAFKNLNQVPVGSDIYVYTSSGKWLHFITTKAETYSMKVLTSQMLFEPTSSRQINLITCAGQLLGNGQATHRLIVSAQLAA